MLVPENIDITTLNMVQSKKRFEVDFVRLRTKHFE